MPFSKMLTFYKSDAFSVTAQYVSDVPIPDKQIGVFDISMNIIFMRVFNVLRLWFPSYNFCFHAFQSKIPKFEFKSSSGSVAEPVPFNTSDTGPSSGYSNKSKQFQSQKCCY